MSDFVNRFIGLWEQRQTRKNKPWRKRLGFFRSLLNQKPWRSEHRWYAPSQLGKQIHEQSKLCSFCDYKLRWHTECSCRCKKWCLKQFFDYSWYGWIIRKNVHKTEEKQLIKYGYVFLLSFVCSAKCRYMFVWYFSSPLPKKNAYELLLFQYVLFYLIFY